MTCLVEHMASRGASPGTYYTDGETATFMLYNGSRLVGYQVYRPGASKEKRNDPREGRYYTYLPRDVDGFYSRDFGGPLYIVEGIFKAIKLHNLGLSAVAVLGATPRRLVSWFRIMRRQRPIIAIGDADRAGAELVKIVGRGFQSPKDLDEMTDAEVRKLLLAYEVCQSLPKTFAALRGFE